MSRHPGPASSASAGAVATLEDAPPGTERALAITGMTCAACAARVERQLNRLEGVSATVNFATERAAVTAPPALGTDQLVAAVRSAGYDATPLERAPDPVAEADRRARQLGRRLVVVAILMMPLTDLSLSAWLLPAYRFAGWRYVLLGLSAPVLTWGAWPFYSAAARQARHLTWTMDTLVTLGIAASTGWSVYSIFNQPIRAGQSLLDLFTHHASGAIYIEVAAGVTFFLLIGRFFEAQSRRRTTRSLGALARLAARDASVIVDGTEVLRPVAALTVGDRFVVRPGERIATDGRVLEGRAGVDRSSMTGESVPVETTVGELVLGGTIPTDGRLVVEATAVGEATQLAHLVRLVEQAQAEKASVQRLADRAAGVMVPAIVAASIVTLAGWLIAGAAAVSAVNAAVSVVIIACPCALGLATPAALLVASGEGARLGVFFKGYSGIETSHRVDTVVFDKTGTLTSGRMSLAHVASVTPGDEDEVLRTAAAVEAASEHPIGRAIHLAALDRNLGVAVARDFVARPGVGALAVVDDLAVEVASASGDGPLAEPARRWVAEGCTVVEVRREGLPIGLIALSDTVRPSAPEAIDQLRRLGLRVVVLSGDRETAARSVGESLGADDVVAEVAPAAKADFVRRLRAEGRTVAVVGDGVNDAPALAAADLGMALGSGTDAAIAAGDVIILGSDLTAVPAAIELADRTLHTIRTNLVWAFAYNVVAVPVAAAGLLNPLIAGAAMACSSLFVVANSARLRRIGDRPA